MSAPIDLDALPVDELLRLHGRLGEELRARGICRTSNNPTGDLAEYLFCRAFGWKQSNNSQANIDAIGEDGTRYQIKGRRLTRYNKSRQISAIRKLHEGHFDVIAGVLFNEDFTVLRAALIPRSVVEARSEYVGHTKSHTFLLRDNVWNAPGVVDVTDRLRSVTFQ